MLFSIAPASFYMSSSSALGFHFLHIFAKTCYFLPFKRKFIYFIYFWLHWVFVAVRGPSSCGEWGLLFVVVRRLLLAVASLVLKHGL